MRNFLVILFFIFIILSGNVHAQQWDNDSRNEDLNNVYASTYSVTLGSDVDFGTVALTGYDLVRTTRMTTIQVKDMRGNGAGWHIDLVATRLALNGDQGAGNPYKTNVPQFTCDGTVVRNGVILGSGTYSSPDPVVDTGVKNLTTAQRVLYAASGGVNGGGRGSFLFTPASANGLSISIPSDFPPGTYTGTITATFTSGPN